jgi:DNA repair exonuclease SbcCD nuclease subunit
MKFAHMADCHIGNWRDPKLRGISTKAFTKAIDICIERNVDFILISGDLFNTSLPGIDKLKQVVTKLKQLQNKDMPVYIVPGSHDFSPSGKTMLDVLEEAGLLINVVKGDIENNKLKLRFTIDKKTGVKITGMLGKKGMLEKNYYENLIKDNLESEEGFKIFMFHTALTEFKPSDLKDMDSSPLSLLPKKFNYYAGGHVHYVFEKQEEGYGLITYPGPLFPNNFKELEELGRGGFYIYEDGKVKFESVQIVNHSPIKIECDNKSAQQIEADLISQIENKEFNNTIVTIRLSGRLTDKPHDIDFRRIFKMLYDKSAFFVMKNTAALTSKEFEEIKIENSSVEEVEERLIKEHLGQIKLDGVDVNKEEALTKQIMTVLNKEKEEGETNPDFDKRLKEELFNILKI